MFCSNCGKQVPDNAVFCGGCGSPLTPATPVVPVMPVSDETIVIPEVPASSPMTDATIVVPEIPTTDATIVYPEVPAIPVPPVPPVAEDPLTAVYPEPPKKKKKTGLIIGLVAAGVLLVGIIVFLILGFVNNWWQDSSANEDGDKPTTGATNPTDPDPGDEPSADELRDELEEFYAGGLYIYLGKDFEEIESNEDEALFESDDVEIMVSWGPTDDLGDFDSSRDFARFMEDSYEDEYDDISREKANDISYLVCTYEDDDEVSVIGCYVQEGYGWYIWATTDEYDTLEQDIINYVTLGLIDEDFTPPAVDEVPEISLDYATFDGLTLMVDASATLGDWGENIYSVSGDSINLYVEFCELSYIGVTSSYEYAHSVYDAMDYAEYDSMEFNPYSDEIYYVLYEIDGWSYVNVAYIYDDVCWLVTGECNNAAYIAPMLDMVCGGSIDPSQIPAIAPTLLSVEYKAMTLELDGSFTESHRDDEYLMLENSDKLIYVFYNPEESQNYATVGQWSQGSYDNYSTIWDHAEIHSNNGVECLILWDEEEGSLSMAYGFYWSGNDTWMIQVLNSGTMSMEEMVALATCGTVPTSDIVPPSQLATRDRIEMTGQLTAEYYGLQVSYGPDWSVDTTYGPTGDYYSNDFTMLTNSSDKATQGVSDAVNLAWKLAEEWSDSWDHAEVGLAGGKPYTLLYDDNSDYFWVYGTYASDDDCWWIIIECYDLDLLDQAIWYATAGQVLDGASTV